MSTRYATGMQVGLHKGRIAVTFTFDDGEPQVYLLTVASARTFAKGTLDLLAELDAFLSPQSAPFEDRLGLGDEVRLTLTPPQAGPGGSNGH